MSNSTQKITKNVIHFKRATPPVLLPVLPDSKNMDELKADSLKQDSPKIDNLKQDSPKADSLRQDNPKIDNRKQDNPEIDSLKQDSPKTDSLIQDNPEIDSLKQGSPVIDNLQLSLVEPRCKTLIRNALLEALGDRDEVMINQLRMRQEIKVAYQTWLNHISVLREREFELIRQPHGTILRKRR